MQRHDGAHFVRRSGEGMMQMAGEYDQGFTQRNHQNGDNGFRHDGNKFSHYAGYKHQRGECNDGGGDGHHHWCSYFLYTIDDGFAGRFPSAKVRIHVFSDNNGIIHQYAERHYECKERDHIDGCTGVIEDDKSAHKGYRDACRNPKCQTEVQK